MRPPPPLCAAATAAALALFKWRGHLLVPAVVLTHLASWMTAQRLQV
jgi:hypothetical protein